MEIWRLKDNGVTPLTFCGHVTSSVTWPFDSRWSISYPWSMVTMRLSITVTKLWRLKYNGVTTLTFWGYVKSSVMWPFDSRESTSYPWFMVTFDLLGSRDVIGHVTIPSGTVTEIWRFKDNGVTTLTFWGHVTSSVTWLFDSPGVKFLWVVHSDHASIWHRYGDMAPQILDAQTWTQKDERIERGKRRGREGKRKAGKGRKGEGKKEWKVKGSGRKFEKERKRKNGKGQKKGKGKEKRNGK